MLLVLTKTKPIQFGERALKVGHPWWLYRGPASAYRQMLSIIPAPDLTAAFSYVIAGELLRSKISSLLLATFDAEGLLLPLKLGCREV